MCVCVYVQLSQRGGGRGTPPELSFNRPLPLELAPPAWCATAFNLAISFMMHSAVLLQLIPPQGSVVLAAHEDSMVADVAAAMKRGGEVHVVLTEHRMYLVDPQEQPIPMISLCGSRYLARRDPPASWSRCCR